MARGASRESFWRRTICGQSKSGLSIRAWCRRHGLAEPTFYWWRKKLARADSSQTAFVPVRVVEEHASGNDTAIEIVLANQRRVRIIGRVDRQALADVLAVAAFGSEAQARREERAC